MTSSRLLKSEGHGILYTLLAFAMICSIEMPTFISPRGAIDRRTNNTPKMATRAMGSMMDAMMDVPLVIVGHWTHRPYCPFTASTVRTVKTTMQTVKCESNK